MPISLTLIVEDRLSEAVMKKMLKETGRGYKVESSLSWDKNKIRKRVSDINESAESYVYLILTDQDTANRCPPNAIRELLPRLVHQNLLYRFAVMEIESWIMAHREAISGFLSVSTNRIPENTDEISNPKEYLINLAKKSRHRGIREDIVPPSNSTRTIGPDYNGRLISFVWEFWDVRVASQFSPSLRRTFERLENFTPTFF